MAPVRALKWYIELSKLLSRGGGGEKALFITSREPYFKATKSTVSGWVKETISGAYSHLTGEQRQQIGAMISEGSQPHGQVWSACHSSDYGCRCVESSTNLCSVLPEESSCHEETM